MSQTYIISEVDNVWNKSNGICSITFRSFYELFAQNTGSEIVIGTSCSVCLCVSSLETIELLNKETTAYETQAEFNIISKKLYIAGEWFMWHKI